MIKAVTKEIVREVEELVRNRSDLLNVSANSDLIDFCWTVISEKLKQKVPILFKILNNVMLEKSKNSIYLLTAMAVLLYGRSNRLNLMQFIFGLVQTKLMKSTKTVKARRSRPPVDKSADIKRMVKCLRSQGLVKDLKWTSFSTFVDPLKCISATDLHTWINEQRKIAALLMK